MNSAKRRQLKQKARREARNNSRRGVRVVGCNTRGSSNS